MGRGVSGAASLEGGEVQREAVAVAVEGRGVVGVAGCWSVGVGATPMAGLGVTGWVGL